MASLRNITKNTSIDLSDQYQDHFTTELLVIGKLLLEAQDLPVVFDSIVSQISRMLEFDRLTIARLERDSNSLVTAHVYGTDIGGWSVGSSREFTDHVFETVVATRSAVHTSKQKPSQSLSENDLPDSVPPDIFRSMIAAPFLVRGDVRGIIALRSKQVDAYSERDLVVIEQIANLLASAMQHYKSITDTEKQLLEKTIIVDLARELSGATEISEFFPAIASAAGQLFEFDYVNMRVIDPSRGEIVAEFSLLGGVLTNHITAPKPWTGTTAVMMAERTSGFIFTRDQIDNPDGGWASLNIGSYDNGYASMLAMPLLHRGGAVGTIVFWSKTENKFTERDIALVEQLGAQISGAVAVAVQHSELRRSINERVIFNQISKSATQSASIREFFESISDQLSTLIQYDRLEVISVNDETKTDGIEFVQGTPVAELVEGTVMPGDFRDVISVTWADRFNAFFGATYEMPVRLAKQYKRARLESWLCVPIHLKEQMYGYLFLHSRESEAFDHFSIELLDRILSYISPAVEHILNTVNNERRIRHNMALGEIGAEIFTTNSAIEMCELVTEHLGTLMSSDLLEIALSPTTSSEMNTFRKLTERIAHTDLPERFDPFVDSIPTTEPRTLIRIADLNDPKTNQIVSRDFITALVTSGISSAIAVPIRDSGGSPGHILVGCVQPDMFDSYDLRNLEVTAKYLSSATQRYANVVDGIDPTATWAGHISSPVSFGVMEADHLGNIELLVVDSLPICRGGYTGLFESAPLNFVGAIDNIANAIKMSTDKAVNVIVLELHNEDVEEIRRLVEDSRVPVLIISDRANKTLISEVIAAGAAGLVLKGNSVEKLVEAIKIVADGGSIYDPSLLAGFLATLRPHEIAPAENGQTVVGSLTEPERRLLSLIAGGSSNKEISIEEGFTVGTIKNQIARLFKKIDASSRVDAAKIAYRSGLVR